MCSKVHRVCYYNPKPELINCVSLNKTTRRIALARANASIEIWDLNYGPYLVKFIPGVEKGSVEALGWVEDRLLSTGLGGALLEWDLNKLCLKSTTLLTGYAAWCLDVNTANTIVAVGTEQGYVNLYSVENNEINYLKLFDKQEGRIMCCKFNKTGDILVTGSVDTIRVWNVQTGQAKSRMSVSRRGKETIVWCLAVLADNIVVSGDSGGRLTFWDGDLGDQIESYVTHKADILSIAVSDDETYMFFSGVDPVIMQFIKVKNHKESRGQWVRHVQRHVHEHDVRSLVIDRERLISVGADGYLTFSKYPPKWVMRIPPMIPSPRTSVSPVKKLLLLRFSTHLEVWKLGSYGTNKNGSVIYDTVNTINTSKQKKGKNTGLEEDSTFDIIDKAKVARKQIRTLKLIEKPLKLVSVQAKGQKQIRCCQLSPSGEFIIYSTDSHIRMLKLDADEEDQGNLSLSKLTISGLPTSCDRIAFTQDSRTMMVHCAGVVHVLQVDPLAGATVVQSINVEKHLKTASVLHLYVSRETASGAIYLVVADTQGAVAVWTKGEKKYEHYVTLPKYKCIPSALIVDWKRDNLIIHYVDQNLIEYELLQRRFAAERDGWRLRSPKAVAEIGGRVAVSMTLHPRRDALLLHDDTSLWVADRQPDEDSEPVAKRTGRDTKPSNIKVVPFKYLADFHWLNDDEAVTVEILPENIVLQLPPVMINK
ncbi:U3 small nucleolar RNA-associated protein 4 homolog [Galleria mellonella]|uniref:U3 small nucleolar RNA-associated protein 4 homolog n=1 Tax=Galleria mellonella TaxID=7137 RepID=A0A6J1X0U4_GALME|nr:U3 small nucleolar RNA-associated protein 4 homolog [Galleria mellonella]